ncbi:MAG TPA: biotin transporter BioY [Coxiellaceae bacterium]|nr:biotin transporter BioY [Coxiellaceae bacterium]
MFAQTTYRSRFLSTDSASLNCLIVLLASLVLAGASQISLPWQPVPLTFQSVAVVLLGLTLGSKRAAAAVALYLLEGACGLPVFAQFYSGISVFAMPSGGYLIGFLPAAFFAGWMMEIGMAKNIFLIFMTALFSTMIIFACGVLQLGMMIGWNDAFAFGVKPFLIVEPLKLMVASLVAKNAFRVRI